MNGRYVILRVVKPNGTRRIFSTGPDTANGEGGKSGLVGWLIVPYNCLKPSGMSGTDGSTG